MGGGGWPHSRPPRCSLFAVNREQVGVPRGEAVGVGRRAGYCTSARLAGRIRAAAGPSGALAPQPCRPPPAPGTETGTGTAPRALPVRRRRGVELYSPLGEIIRGNHGHDGGASRGRFPGVPRIAFSPAERLPNGGEAPRSSPQAPRAGGAVGGIGDRTLSTGGPVRRGVQRPVGRRAPSHTADFRPRPRMHV